MEDDGVQEDFLEDTDTFPLRALMPRKETQQESFLARFPEYDGRGILMAILDTGVDPAMPGLQTTPTGERKIVDCVDVSGSGDVDTSTVKTATEEGPDRTRTLEGITGRKLRIPQAWVNPSGKWHLGSKPIFELYNKSLLTTLRNEKKEEVWKSAQQLALADASRLLCAHEEAIGGTSEKLADKLDRENLACHIDFLRAQDKVEDKGPIADVVTWNDGEKWMSCIDTSFRGRLALCSAMASFRYKGEWAKLTDKDGLSYCFNVHPSGKVTEVCVPSGGHGTHVANIAAAYFPQQKEKNGLAPGVQIVSMNIGDGRVGAMETGQALTRAFDLCSTMGVNIVNMSFGEFSHFPDKGRIIEQLKKMVEKHNVLFICSAGNNGPALTSLGSPGGTSSTVLGIAAFLSPGMADPMYGIFSKNVPANLFGWSSRGPTSDGSLGLSLTAPGAAVTGVPVYCRKSNQLMNGTSMSSPNAAGSISCLLSALKAIDKYPSVAQIRLALENTASIVDGNDKLSIGHGMIQIEKAFDYLEKIRVEQLLPPALKHLEVQCNRAGHPATRGVYLRDAIDSSSLQEFTVGVNPMFGTDEAEYGVSFERALSIRTSVPWVRTPSSLLLNNQQCKFNLHVDPTRLPANTVHYTEVELVDTLVPEAGPILRIPITVIKPLEMKPNETSLSFEFTSIPGIPHRTFVQIPREATAAVIRLHNTGGHPREQFVVHCTQVVKEKSLRESEMHKLWPGDQEEFRRPFAVRGGKTLEVCVYRAWSRELKEVPVRAEVEFTGLQTPPVIQLSNANFFGEIPMRSWERKCVEVQPSLQLKHIVQVIRPLEVKLHALLNRDVFVDGTVINRLLLTYKLNIPKSSDVHLELGGLTEFLYEAPLDCILFQVFSSTKEYMGASSSYPNRYTLKLEKGEYRVQAQIRHPSEGQLDKMRDTPLSVSTRLPSAVSLDLYKEVRGAVEGDASLKVPSTSTMLPAGHECVLYVGQLPDDKIPKGTTTGSYFKGVFSPYGNKDFSSVSCTSLPVVFTLNEYGKRQSKALSTVTLAAPKKKEEAEMTDAFRDVQIDWIEKSKEDAVAVALYDKVREEHPSHLPLHLSLLRRLAAKPERPPEMVERLLTLSNLVADLTRPDELLQWLGAKHDHDEDNVTQKTAMEERRSAIIDALLVKAATVLDAHLAISTMEVPKSLRRQIGPIIEKKEKKAEEGGEGASGEATPTEATAVEVKAVEGISDPGVRVTLPEVDTVLKELYLWIDPTDSKCLLVSAKHAAAHGHLGRALKYLQKLIEDATSGGKDSKAYEEAVADICDQLGWTHVANLHRNRILNRHRPTYRLF